MELQVKPCAGMCVVEVLGPVEQVLAKGLVVPDFGGYKKGDRTSKPRSRRMRGVVVKVANCVTRIGVEVLPGIERGATVWYYEGVSKAGYRWREGDGRHYATVPVRELICEEVA